MLPRTSHLNPHNFVSESSSLGFSLVTCIEKSPSVDVWNASFFLGGIFKGLKGRLSSGSGRKWKLPCALRTCRPVGGHAGCSLESPGEPYNDLLPQPHPDIQIYLMGWEGRDQTSAFYNHIFKVSFARQVNIDILRIGIWTSLAGEEEDSVLSASVAFTNLSLNLMWSREEKESNTDEKRKRPLWKQFKFLPYH